MRVFPSLRLALALLLVAVTGAAFVQPASSQAQEYSTQASLIDGVEGLAVDRLTTITASVWAIESIDDLMLVGGAFTEVRDRSSFARIPRPYLAAFDPTTGEYVPWWQTQPDGVVYDILDLGDGRAVLIGEFESVNGVAGTDGVAIIDVATGEVDTSLSLEITAGSSGSVIRAGAIDGDWLYLTGSFASANDGSGSVSTAGLARISLTTGNLDSGWTPTLEGGGGWGIGVASTGRVFVGGYFATVNGVADTETLVALNPSNGSVVAGWNHGFPHDICNLSWRSTCGAVNGLAVVDDKVFVAGAKHFWAALSVSDGTILADKEISNDGQTVDVIDGLVIVGCHCTHSDSDDWPGITDRFIRVIDPDALIEIESPTVNTTGSAGGWGADEAPDGCLWAGGAFSATMVNGVSHPAWNLLRFCPPGGPTANPTLHAAPRSDTTAPSIPGRPSVTSQLASTIDLSWSRSTDGSGQLGYLVYRNGALVGRTSDNHYSDPLLDPSAVYEWRVAAFDMAGNTSELSTRSAPVEIGPRYNVAAQGTVAMSPAFDATTEAGKAIDGNTNGDPAAASIARADTVEGDDQPWWGIDLGSVRNIDYVQIHPRTDDSFSESNNRVRVSHDTTVITGQSRAELSEAAHPAWVGGITGAAPRIEQAELAASARYLRLVSNSSRLSLAEVQIMTVDPKPTPAAPALDTTDPTGPSWKNTTDRGANTMLKWGGANDDVAVAYYQIYQGSTLVATTTDQSFPVGAAGQAASSFTVLAFDAAGNASDDIPGGGGGGADNDVATCSAIRDGASVAVSWTAPSSPEKFIIRRTVDGGSTFWRGSATGSSRTWTDTDRTGTLAYTVESRNGQTSGPATNCTTQDDGGDGGGGGENDDVATCSAIRDGASVAVSWSAPNDPDKFVIRRTVNGGSSFWRGSATGSSRTWTDTDRTGTLAYTVESRNGSVSGPAVNCTTQDNGGGGALAAPASCSWSTAGNVITVDWAAVASADSVIVQRRVDGGTWWWRGRADVPATSFDDTTRTGSIDYRVKARYAAGDSATTTCTAN